MAWLWNARKKTEIRSASVVMREDEATLEVEIDKQRGLVMRDADDERVAARGLESHISPQSALETVTLRVKVRGGQACRLWTSSGWGPWRTDDFVAVLEVPERGKSSSWPIRVRAQQLTQMGYIKIVKQGRERKPTATQSFAMD